MSDSVASAGQRASLLADASLDQETRFGIDDQLNDASSSSSASAGGLQAAGSSSTFSNSISVADQQSKGESQATPKITDSGDIPTGMDAIKAAGAQGKTEAYCEPHQ